MFLLVRHGETDWNREGRWQGHRGRGLNERGRLQARELAAQIDGVDAIYSSDTDRARETAEILGAQLGLEVTMDARLREVSFGEWEGLTRGEIEDRHPGAVARWEADERPPPAFVEPDEAMAERVLEALRAIGDEHPEGRVLVVTSGGPIRAAQAHLRGIEQTRARRLIHTVENCALVELVVHTGTFEQRADDRVTGPE